MSVHNKFLLFTIDNIQHTDLLDQISHVADAQTHLLPDDDDFEIPDNPDDNTEIHVIEASSPKRYRNHEHEHEHDDDDEFESHHHHEDIPHVRHTPRAREVASTPVKKYHRQPEVRILPRRTQFRMLNVVRHSKY